MAATKRKPGRPKEPVPAKMADRICEWIAEGKTLRDFCRQPDTPARRTVDDWRAKDNEFAARFARARDIGFDVLAEECLAIADTPLEGVRTEEGTNEKGAYSKTVTEDMLGHRRLQIETRQKLLAKWDPKRYGERRELDVAVTVNVDRITDEDRELLLRSSENVDDVIDRRLARKNN